MEVNEDYQCVKIEALESREEEKLCSFYDFHSWDFVVYDRDKTVWVSIYVLVSLMVNMILGMRKIALKKQFVWKGDSF